MSDTYPNQPPLSPAPLKGVATVKGSTANQFFTVDFDTGECDCQHGAAWRWSNKRWVPNSMCSHKLRAIASKVKSTEDERLRDFYETELGRRFNPFEVVSAFHKELRRGDSEEALYWATMLIPHRGRHNVIGYMRNILFEETRDLSLAKYILKLSAHGKSVTAQNMQRAVRRFAEAPKKWELPWRKDIFLNEMRAYKRLGETFGYDVAKAKDIIPVKEVPALQGKMQEGFTDGDYVTMQYGLKGWFKSQSKDHEQMKIEIFNMLVEVMNGERPNGFQHDEDYAHALYTVIMTRIRNHGQVGYHELNAFADALSGEPGADPRAGLSKVSHKKITASPRRYRVPLGSIRRIPIYAHDNHTWGGKAKMRQYGTTQLRPGADQTDMDFRLCGAYMGVAWRTLAFDQHATIDCKWGDVSWSKPNWLWQHLDNMWY